MKCSRGNIVRLLTNSDFALSYKGFWEIWDGRIVGVGFCGVGIEVVGFIRECGMFEDVGKRNFCVR